MLTYCLRSVMARFSSPPMKEKGEILSFLHNITDLGRDTEKGEYTFLLTEHAVQLKPAPLKL